MVGKQVLEDRKKDTPSIDDVTTPLWTKEMGERMATVRMKMLKDQTELSAELHMTQPNLSKIERGVIRVTDRLTIADLKRVFGTNYMFILFGNNPERFNSGVIKKKYWDSRLRERRVNKSVDSKSRVL